MPRSLRHEAVRLRRVAMLHEPHIAPLTRYVERLRLETGLEVPYFDPLDGGIEARVLFLYEKPGPMTSSEGSARRSGSGFISRNNDDQTAEATFRFMVEAGLSRRDTLTWNIVPGWNGTRKVTADELRSGVHHLRDLMPLLPGLQAVVLVGGKARRAEPFVESLKLKVFTSDHPSPIVRRTREDRWNAIPSEWVKVSTHISGADPPGVDGASDAIQLLDFQRNS